MKTRSRLFGVAIAIGVGGLGFAAGACGGDTPYLANDAGTDAPPAQTFTAFVIDLVNNHTDNSLPTSYATFKDLSDPDDHNPTVYSSLFH